MGQDMSQMRILRVTKADTPGWPNVTMHRTFYIFIDIRSSAASFGDKLIEKYSQEAHICQDTGDSYLR